MRLWPSWRGETTLRSSHQDRKSTRLNSSHLGISYAVFCLKKKKEKKVRFGCLVRDAGRPEGLTLWTKAGEHALLANARKERRIQPVHQDTGERARGVLGCE